MCLAPEMRFRQVWTRMASSALPPLPLPRTPSTYLGAARAVKWLRHVPLCAGVEELEDIAGLYIPQRLCSPLPAGAGHVEADRRRTGVVAVEQAGEGAVWAGEKSEAVQVDFALTRC